MQRFIFTGMATMVLAAGSAAADPLDVFGKFAVRGGTSHVEISDCGNATPCGHIVWIDPASLEPGEQAETLTDAKGAKILGLQLLKGFTARSGDWRGGTIYDPEAGRVYASRLKRLANGALEVKGCIGPVCQTQIWTAVR
ncbi:MAG: DUF2147 domain-containing protein [Hyphomonas sp.]